MKFAKLNKVIVKNSLYVLLFVISYTAILRYYDTENFFTTGTFDSVFGWQGTHENPDLKNQTEESCRQAALKDPKYVAYGYRTPEHPDPVWRNTCFLYTKGFGPFNGNPNDKAHKTGCLRPGEKVSEGCKPVVQPTTSTTTSDVNCPAAAEQYLKDYPDVKKAGVDAWTHYNKNGKNEGRKWNSTLCTTSVDSVFGWQGTHENPDLKNQTEESCRQAALKDPKYVAYGYRTPEHPDPVWRNTCFLYTKGFGPFNGNPNDKAHKTGCLRPGEKVSEGCKPVPVAQPTTTPVVQPTPTPAPVAQPTTTPVVQPTPTPVVQPAAAPVVKADTTPVVQPAATPVVQPTPIQQVQEKPTPISIQPIIQAPAFKQYDANIIQATEKTTVEVKEEPKISPTPETQIQVVSSPPATSFTSKFIMYVLLSIIVSILVIGLLIWGAVSISKARTLSNTSY